MPRWSETTAEWTRVMSPRITTLMAKPNPGTSLFWPNSHMSKLWDSCIINLKGEQKRAGSAGSALSASLNSLQGSDKMTSNYIFKPNLESPQAWEKLLFECLSSQPPPPYICWTHYTINRGFLNIKGGTGFISRTSYIEKSRLKMDFLSKKFKKGQTQYI